ncbi:MAG: hypothetical protein IAF08_02535, partial [Rhizobacter sp.]|nr:hypothetical protein [Chlorobiales bacterium]
SGELLPAYLAFFDYIRDDAEDNVHFAQQGEAVWFEIQQGSKTLRGTASATGVTAEASVAKMEKPSVAVMRRVLENNFRLNYTRYALRPDNTLCIRFDAGAGAGQPYKLYYALKEAALNADMQDDLLVQEFTALKPVDTTVLEMLPDDEKEVKYRFFVKWIEETLKRIAMMNADKQAGGIAWQLMALVYRLDYLLSPQGKTMNEIEKIHGFYYAKDGKTFPEKNLHIRAMLEKLLAKPKSNVVADFYRVKATFAVTQPSGPQAVVNSITDANRDILWWRDNDKEHGMTIALASLEHGATYATFNYSLPQPVAELFELQMRVFHADFFGALGFMENYYDADKKTFSEASIRNRIDTIVQKGRERFPQLVFRLDNIKFTSLLDFGYSFTEEVKYLAENFSKPQS